VSNDGRLQGREKLGAIKTPQYLFGILQAQDNAHKVLSYLLTGPSVVHKLKRNYSLDGML
jgi:hypothetical protein